MESLPLALGILLSAASILPAYGFEPEAMDCTKGNIAYVEFLYKSNIMGINDAVRLYKESHPGADLKSLTNYVYSPFLNKVSDSAKCLEDLGVNPLTVAQFSAEAQQVLSYDPQSLSGMAPEFARYVPIPEFGTSVPVLLAAIAALVAIRRANILP